MVFRNFRFFLILVPVLIAAAISGSNAMAEIPRISLDDSPELRGPAVSTIRYVAEGGDDGNPGSIDLPFATIQHAITQSFDGDEVWVEPGTYSDTGNRDITFMGKAITVRSSTGDPATTIIDCDGTMGDPHRGFIFENDEGPGSVLRGFTITDGYVENGEGGGILLDGSDPTVSPYTEDGASPTIEDCLVLVNTGGGVRVRGKLAAPTFTDCHFNENIGVGVSIPWGNGNFTDCDFNYNTSHGFHRESSKSGLFDFTGCDFIHNYADGIVGNLEAAEITMTQCLVDFNQGDGIFVSSGEYGEIIINDSVISNNTGAGFNTYWAWMDVEIYDSQILDNDLSGLDLGSPSYSYRVIDNCKVIGNGGWGLEVASLPPKNHRAVDKASDYTLDISNCEITRNVSGGIIGEFVLSRGPVRINRTLVNENEGDGIDLSLYGDQPGDLTILGLDGVTIADNDGVGLTANADSLMVQNVIVAFNGGDAMNVGAVGHVAISCTDIFGNLGDWTGPIIGFEGSDGNISQDPQFCRADDFGNPYTLMDESPCAEEFNPGCGGPIGAFGVGCSSMPEIAGIIDVGNDQGRQVRISWLRSAYDQAGSLKPVTGYGIYRRMDAYKSQSQATRVGDKFAGWDFITTIPARGDSAYQFVAPTLCDSTINDGMCYSAFIVSAMTASPLVYFDSPADSGYSVDNLSPLAPGNILANYSSERNDLAWDLAQESDFSHFLVYRTLSPDDSPDEDSIPLVQLTTNSWADAEFEVDAHAWKYHYWVVTVDHSGNRSQPSSPHFVVDVGDPALPGRNALHAAVPNPFNPRTTISFDLAKPATVDLKVFDISGRMVKSLIGSEARQPGTHSVHWSGRDDSGRGVAAGIYFYRLQAGEFVQTSRMTLMK